MPIPAERHLRQLRILSWPFHNGLRDVGMGSGPIRLASDNELRAGIEAEGWSVSSEEIEPVDESDPEIVRVVELIRRLAQRVAKATAEGAFPFVLAGNCNSALGTTAGIGAEDLGVVWFDAHADFDDPDENTSGRLNVAAAAITAYDPAFDPDGSTRTAATAVAREIARGIRTQPTSGTG